jgi:hypothetical protein
MLFCQQCSRSAENSRLSPTSSRKSRPSIIYVTQPLRTETNSWPLCVIGCWSLLPSTCSITGNGSVVRSAGPAPDPNTTVDYCTGTALSGASMYDRERTALVGKKALSGTSSVRISACSVATPGDVRPFPIRLRVFTASSLVLARRRTVMRCCSRSCRNRRPRKNHRHSARRTGMQPCSNLPAVLLCPATARLQLRIPE